MADFTVGKATPFVATGGHVRPVQSGLDLQATLYYEVHINVPLTLGDRRTALAEMAKAARFKLSDMDGHSHSDRKETILTCHGQSYLDTERRTRTMVEQLKTNGFKIIRYKIENAVLDSRVKDVWDMVDD